MQRLGARLAQFVTQSSSSKRNSVGSLPCKSTSRLLRSFAMTPVSSNSSEVVNRPLFSNEDRDFFIKQTGKSTAHLQDNTFAAYQHIIEFINAHKSKLEVGQYVMANPYRYVKKVAVNLALYFGDGEAAIRWVNRQNKSSAKTYAELIQLFIQANHTLPEMMSRNHKLELWQQLAVKHHDAEQFSRIYLVADRIEAFVAEHNDEIKKEMNQIIRMQHIKKYIAEWDSIAKALHHPDRVAINDYVIQQLQKFENKLRKMEIEQANQQMLARLGLSQGPYSEVQKQMIQVYKLTDEYLAARKQIAKKIRDEKIVELQQTYRSLCATLDMGRNKYVDNQLLKCKEAIHHDCLNAHRHILSPHTDLATLSIYAANVIYKNAHVNRYAAQIFFRFNLSEECFNFYLSLSPFDSDRHIPPVKIDGAIVGHAGYSLEKLPAASPIAAVLGKLTGCCQSLDNQYGWPAVRHGIENARGGFYVLKRVKDNTIVAQCWAWRSESTNNLVFDSIESEINYRSGDRRRMVCDMFSTLAHRLVEHHQVPNVLVGTGGNTPAEFGGVVTRIEDVSALDYTDADEQRVVASRNPHQLEDEISYSDMLSMRYR